MKRELNTCRTLKQECYIFVANANLCLPVGLKSRQLTEKLTKYRKSHPLCQCSQREYFEPKIRVAFQPQEVVLYIDTEKKKSYRCVEWMK